MTTAAGSGPISLGPHHLLSSRNECGGERLDLSNQFKASVFLSCTYHPVRGRISFFEFCRIVDETPTTSEFATRFCVVSFISSLFSCLYSAPTPLRAVISYE
jgi:hypothetical protein